MYPGVSFARSPKPPPPECPRCGSTSFQQGPGKPPHSAKLVCAECNRFIKWLSKAQTLGGGNGPDCQDQYPSTCVEAAR